jgi:hypothetical protein
MDRSQIDGCISRIDRMRLRLDAIILRSKKGDDDFIVEDRQLCEDLISEAKRLLREGCAEIEDKERWGLPDPFTKEDDDALDFKDEKDEEFKARELTRPIEESHSVLGDLAVELKGLLNELEK